MTRFHGMTRFTIADFNKGYWMVELDPESRKYTTMALDIGRFQWTRLPMGSIVAQDVFQRKLNAIFLDIPGVTGIADDMVIYGKTDLEHDRHLINFLNICRKNTLMTKCNSGYHRFRSLDINGVPGGSVQIQRRLQQSRGWICLKMLKQCEVF